MEEQNIVNDYINNILTVKELADKYHYGQEYILNILKKNKVKMRTCFETITLKKNPGLTIEEIYEKIIDNYQNKQYGLVKSGKEFQISGSTVKKILKENNVEIRNLHEAIQISNQVYERGRVYKINNREFFNIPSKNMAWLMGFIASDGNIRKDEKQIRIELSIVDKEILERIREAVGIENPVKERENKKGFTFAYFRWNCKEHVEDLAKYSIVPCKTYILEPPISLDKDYRLDYIRGYFDGDGTINLNQRKDGRKSLRWGICGASIKVLQWIVDTLSEYGISPVNIHRDSSHENPFYSIIYSTNAAKAIYHLIYDDMEEDTLFLKRKKDRYDELLKLFKE